MNVPMSWEPLEEPAKVRLLMQLDVLRSMVADAEPVHVYDTVELVDGRRVSTSHVAYDGETYEKRWRARLPGC